MVKPFPSHVRDKQDTLTDGNVGGGTPLSDALVVSRERVRQEPNFPFMFVVSDGMPFDTNRYLDELEATDFPVVGVTIGRGTAADFDEYYDVARTATAENIGDELVALATEIMF
jgi:Mg-chelatase subunit ChlD